MGEALIVRRGGSSGGEVTIDGEKVNTKMNLLSNRVWKFCSDDINTYEYGYYTTGVAYEDRVHILHGHKAFHSTADGGYWEQRASTPMGYYALGIEYHGKLHTFGGCGNSSGNPTLYHYMYSYDTDSWTQLDDVPGDRYDYTLSISESSCVVYNDCIYLYTPSKSKLRQYDGSSWSTISVSCPTKTFNYCNKLVVFDGELCLYNSSYENNITKLYKYNFNTKTFNSYKEIGNFYSTIVLVADNVVHSFKDDRNKQNHYIWDGNSLETKNFGSTLYHSIYVVDNSGSIHSIGGSTNAGVTDDSKYQRGKHIVLDVNCFYDGSEVSE